jgi:hypothetical protein
MAPKQVDFYDDAHWPKIIAMLEQLLAAGKAAECQIVSIDLSDMMESVLALPSGSNGLTETQFSSLSDQELIAFAAKNRAERGSQSTLAEVVSDTFTIGDFIAKNGTWLFTEYESPTYYAINIEGLKVHQS